METTLELMVIPNEDTKSKLAKAGFKIDDLDSGVYEDIVLCFGDQQLIVTRNDFNRLMAAPGKIDIPATLTDT